VFEALSKEGKYSDIDFVQIDVDDLGEAAMENSISSVPTFQFRNKDTILHSMVGAQEQSLRDNLDMLSKA
jgi:hypothetical protein